MSTLSNQVTEHNTGGFDVEKLREDLPVLKQNIHGKPLVYLDSAATAQKPFAAMEHHSNIVPCQMLCEETGATLRLIPMNERGELLMDEYEKLLTPRTKMVAVTHVSNALGTINPVKQIIDMAHGVGALTLID